MAAFHACHAGICHVLQSMHLSLKVLLNIALPEDLPPPIVQVHAAVCRSVA